VSVRVCCRATIAMTFVVAAAAAASADTPLRVVILESERDAALVARVEGQVADLDATLERITIPPAAASLASQLAAARRLARSHDANAVVWFAQDGDDWIVHVADADGDRVLVRRVQGRSGAMGRSAAIEAAAVIVRTAVRGLAAGGEIGVASEPLVEPAPVPVAVAAPAPAPPPAAPADDLGSVRPLRPTATVAWTGVLDGEADTGHHGVGARLGVAGGPWRFALGLAHHPATTHAGAMATIAVERQTLAVALGLDVAGGAQLRRAVRWRVGAEVAFGMTRFSRVTTLTDPTVEPTADRATWSPTATPAIRVARRLARGAWLELALGADLVARAPEFGVATPNGFASLARLWPVEPHLGLGVVVDPF
jgi:hypothetical protein